MAAIRCHYEVLAVERDVDDDTLKKAYRKLALKWHPDKNQGQIELATEQFKLIHNAYAVLSDPHERAWYDAHRDAILRGKSGVRGDGDDDDDDPVANLWSFFSTNAYSGFGDDARGFFSVYDKVFMDLDDEERRFAEKPSERRAPRFNDSNAGWREVKAFYDYWEAFSTQRSCAGADKYDTRAAANRQVRRAMEKENNKSRLEARRKVNECVRALVAYVRKRDKRVIAHQLAQEEEKRAKEAKLRTERAARQAEADEARRLQTAQLEANRDSAAAEEEQRRLDALLNEYEEEGGSGPRKKKGKGKKGGGGKNASVAEDEAANVGECTEPMGVADGGSDAMFCEACNKRFTNFGQWKNHEKSKKHHDMMRLLSERLAAEDEEFAAELAEAEAQVAKEAAHEQEQSSSDGDDSVEADLDGTAGREKAEAGLSDASASSEVDDDDDDLLLRLAGSRLHHSSSHAAHTGREASRGVAVAQSASVVDGADGTVRLGDAHEVGGECKGGGPSLRGEAASSEGEEDTAPSSTSESAPQSLSKKKARELKKAARAALKSDGLSSSDKYVKSQRGELVCSTCGYRAPSRNQLFNHLKALGHAAFKG